ncbi:MAG: hypothetical protein Tsb009_19230 [Planctomycetaceae bacterium]
MSEVIRDVVVRIRLEQVGNKLTVPDTRQVTGAFDTVNKKASASVKQRLKDEKSVRDSNNLTAKEAVANAQKVRTESIKAAEGFKTLGDGAFTFARGAAFLFTDTEDGLKKLVENISIAQGAFDLFRGGVDVVKGLKEGIGALSAVSQASAAANTALAASNTAVATTGSAAATATTGLTAALGPLGIALGIAGAAYAAYVAFQQKSKKASEEEAKAEREKARQLRESARQFQRFSLQKIRDAGGREASLFSAGASSFSELQAIRRQRDELLKVTDTKKELLAIEKESAEVNKRFNRSLAITSTKLLIQGKLLEKIAAVQKKFPKGGPQADNAAAKVVEEHILQNLDSFKRDVSSSKGFAAATQAVESAKLIVERNQQMKSLLESRLSILDRIKDASKQNLDTAKEELRTAKERVELEKQKAEAAQIAAGRLDPRQRAQLSRLGEKVSSGQQLNRRELQLAEQLGGSIPAIQQFVNQQLRKSGTGFASDISRKFGGKSLVGEGSVLQELQAAEQKNREIVRETQGKAQEVATSTAREQAAILQVMKVIVEKSRTFQQEIADIRNRLDERDANGG